MIGWKVLHLCGDRGYRVACEKPEGGTEVNFVRAPWDVEEDVEMEGHVIQDASEPLNGLILHRHLQF
jgi:hypothetical protein